jgi:hypothetical protein
MGANLWRGQESRGYRSIEGSVRELKREMKCLEEADGLKALMRQRVGMVRVFLRCVGFDGSREGGKGRGHV